MKSKLVVVTLGWMGVALATHAGTLTFTFLENGPNLDLGNTSTFTEGGTSLMASGFTAAGSPSDLFSKFTSGNPGETGLGMVVDSGNDHEIDPAHFIQLDMSNLKGTASSSLWLGSVQSGESGVVYATMTPGSLVGATAIGTLTSDGSLNITSWVNAGDFIDITAGSQNVVISSLTATSRDVPDTGSTVLLLGAALSGLGLVRRKYITS